MKTFATVLAIAYATAFLPQNGAAQTEYKYDDGVGATVLSLSTNDTVAVYFDAVANYVLDSIRVAFNKAGSMSFGMWRYTGTPSSPLGAVMAGQSAITVTTADQNSTLPTTAGTTKWVKKDLTSLSLSTNPGFVVVGIIGADPSTPGVLVSQVPITGSEHSLTYTTGQWRILTSSSNVYRYLIRAYAHQVTPAGVDVVELQPSSFYLKQNYPNPFNGQTQIEYEIASNRVFVDLSIYNVLGEKVRTLVHAEEAMGRYVQHWDGTDDNGLKLVSGIYFYRLSAGAEMISKKMLYVK